MSVKKTRKGVKRAYQHVKNAFIPFFSPVLVRFHRWVEGVRLGVTKPQAFAYRIIGERTARFLPLFKDMDANLRKSGMRISFKAYVSLAILMALLVSVSVLVLIPLLLIFVLHLPFLSSLLFGIGAGLLGGALTIVGFYVYPIYRADNLKRTLEDGLPFTTGYLAILAGAGVPPDKFFRSLAQVDAPLAVSKEARTVVRDVELLGFDVISALEAASDRTPSVMFKELLEGFIATIHSGGGLTKYLRDRSRQYMRLKRIALRRFSDTLQVLAEFYVTLLVAGPLILVVMLAVMAMLGGGGQGLLDPRLLLYLLTYLGIPVGSIVFLIVLDVVYPRR
ncbi:MAG: type II secretion system F family protein [Candidatus Bathyarchaeia archaeon]